MKHGVKIRIYPNKEQEELLFYYCKVAHNAWNYLVAKYKDNKRFPGVSKFGIKGLEPYELRSEMGESIPQRIYVGIIRTYAQAILSFYKKNTYVPKFHKYNPNKQSFYCSSTTLPIRNNRVKLIITRGYKLQSKEILLDLDDMNYYNCTEIIEPRYTYQNGQWYLSGCCNIDDVSKNINKRILGLDWGIKNFMTGSNGIIINYPKSILRLHERLKHLQRHLDNKQRGSNNYNKVLNKIKKLYNRSNNLKRDFIEKTTKKLALEYNIAVEDIDMISLLLKKNKKKYIRQRNFLAPHSIFTNKLKWKCEKYGSYFIEVNPKYTSMECCRCGNINTNLTLDNRLYVCKCCGNVIDRDKNAAINICKRGKEILSQ